MHGVFYVDRIDHERLPLRRCLRFRLAGRWPLRQTWQEVSAVPTAQHRSVSPWEARRPGDIPTWEELDALPDVRLTHPTPPVED